MRAFEFLSAVLSAMHFLAGRKRDERRSTVGFVEMAACTYEESQSQGGVVAHHRRDESTPISPG